VTWARGILWIVLLAATAGAIYFGMGWYQYNLKLEGWRTEVLMEMPVDISKEETIKCTVTPSSRMPCRLQFVLMLDTKEIFDKSVLKPLSASCTITEMSSPIPINRFDINSEFVIDHQGTLNAFVIASMHPWESEPRRFQIKINNAVSKLEGIKQRLLIKNQLCGMEGMVLFVYGLFASLCFIAGLIAVCVLYQMRKSRLSPVPEVTKASDEVR
jgi:hypothetical protein